MRQSDIKSEEIRLLIEKMEGYKHQRDAEVLKWRKKAAAAEEDVKVLIVEQERNKRDLNDRIKMLSEIFK